jgi:uroporphyrinogen-III decarboxylase
MVSVSEELMDGVGIHLPAAHRDPILMGRLSAAAFELCGLKVPHDIIAEVEALGGDIDFGDDKTLPKLHRPFLSNPEDLEIPADFMKLKRVPLILDAIGWCRRHYGSTVPVISSKMLRRTARCGRPPISAAGGPK